MRQLLIVSPQKPLNLCGKLPMELYEFGKNAWNFPQCLVQTNILSKGTVLRTTKRKRCSHVQMQFNN